MSKELKRVKAVDLNNPLVGAVASKLVEPRFRQARQDPDTPTPPNHTLLNRISSHTATNIVDARNIFQMLPDTNLSAEILVSTILAPKDLVNVELIYQVTSTLFDTNFTTPMLEVVRNYFENDYKINDELPKMLEAMLFTAGSYPLAILPESTIDAVINSHQQVTVESISSEFNNGNLKNMGVLVKPGRSTAAIAYKGVGLEDFNPLAADRVLEFKATSYDPIIYNGRAKLPITVVDNPSLLKIPVLRDKLAQDKLQNLYGRNSIGMESQKVAKSFGVDKTNSFYTKRNYRMAQVVALKPSDLIDKPTVGHPMVMKLPPESLIPVHVPGNPEEHVAYFALLDITGNPITTAFTTDYYNDLSNNLAMPQQMAAQINTLNLHNGTGRSSDLMQNQMNQQELQNTFTNIIEDDLRQRLSGVYGSNVEIGKVENIYRVMLARTLSAKQTQILFIPAEMVSYFAFDYNQYGVGSSLLDQTKILGSLRVMILFANTLAALKNSIPRSRVNIKLSEKEHDPAGAVNFMMHEYSKNRSASFPIGASHPLDVIDFIQRASIDFAVTGNSRYPDTEFNVEDYASNKQMVSTELDENLKRRHIMAFGLSPETVESAQGADFATTVVQNNLLLAKRALRYQKLFCSQLSDFVRKFVFKSSILMDALRTVVKNNVEHLPTELKAALKKYDEAKPEDKDTTLLAQHSVLVERIVTHFLKTLNVTLPAPDTATIENQVSAFQAYADGVDAMIDNIIDPGFLDGTALGELADGVDSVKAAMRASILRKYMRDNNLLPELTAMAALDEDGKPESNIIDQHLQHVDILGKTMKDYLEKVVSMRNERDKQMEKVDDKADAGKAILEGGGSTDDAGGEDVDIDGGMDDDLMGGEDNLDNLDGGENEGGTEGEESPEDNPEETSEGEQEEEPAESETGNANPAPTGTGDDVNKTE